jgi:hypothetical protein
VIRGPFRPFPRWISGIATHPGSLSSSKGTILPKPPWFVSARTGAVVCEGLTRHRADGGTLGLVKTLTRALRA